MVSNSYDDIICKLYDNQRSCSEHKRFLQEVEGHFEVLTGIDFACWRNDGRVLLCKYSPLSDSMAPPCSLH